MKALLLVAVATSAIALGGCTAPTDAKDDGPGEELKSADCPPSLAVIVNAPAIPSDGDLVKIYTRFQAETLPFAGSPADQVTQIGPWLEKARADSQVSLKGAVGRACAYRTTNATTGAVSDRSIWLSKSQGGSFSLRMSQPVEGMENILFFNVPLKSVSRTAVVVDTSKAGHVYAENTSRGHDGSDGWSLFIGDVTASVEVIP